MYALAERMSGRNIGWFDAHTSTMAGGAYALLPRYDVGVPMFVVIEARATPDGGKLPCTSQGRKEARGVAPASHVSTSPPPAYKSAFFTPKCIKAVKPSYAFPAVTSAIKASFVARSAT